MPKLIDTEAEFGYSLKKIVEVIKNLPAAGVDSVQL